jgi:hypothetical protein
LILEDIFLINRHIGDGMARGSALNNTPSLTATAATRVSTGGQLHAEHGQQVVYLNFLRHSYADAL